MKKIVIFGAGPAAESITEYIKRDTNDEVVAYTVDKAYCTADTFNDLPLIPWEDFENHYKPNDVYLFGPISFRKLNRFRKERFEDGKRKGYSFYTFIHPSIYRYTENIGENVLILEGCTIEPFSTIGDNVIIWSQCILGHHCKIGDHCFVSAGSCIGGATTLGEGVFCGGRVNVYDHITIGSWSLVAACARLATSVADDSLVTMDKVLPKAARRFGEKLLG